MATFCKSANCPSPLELLQFQNNEIAPGKRRTIEGHLNRCEFCEAEVEFYANHPQSEVICGTAEIPAPLLELAEALLGNKHKDFLTLNRLLSGEELTCK
ncbi:MAG: hypothetical protein R2747_09060 [Pyrinomonadaceae bacterium]